MSVFCQLQTSIPEWQHDPLWHSLHISSIMQELKDLYQEWQLLSDIFNQDRTLTLPEPPAQRKLVCHHLKILADDLSQRFIRDHSVQQAVNEARGMIQNSEFVSEEHENMTLADIQYEQVNVQEIIDGALKDDDNDKKRIYIEQLKELLSGEKQHLISLINQVRERIDLQHSSGNRPTLASLKSMASRLENLLLERSSADTVLLHPRPPSSPFHKPFQRTNLINKIA